MGFGSHYITSPGWCFLTEDYNEYMNKQYHNDNDDNEKLIPDWFNLQYCDVCVKRKESSQITFVSLNSHMKSRYRVLFAEMDVMFIILAINKTLHVHLSVM